MTAARHRLRTRPAPLALLALLVGCGGAPSAAPATPTDRGWAVAWVNGVGISRATFHARYVEHTRDYRYALRPANAAAKRAWVMRVLIDEALLEQAFAAAVTARERAAVSAEIDAQVRRYADPSERAQLRARLERSRWLDALIDPDALTVTADEVEWAYTVNKRLYVVPGRIRIRRIVIPVAPLTEPRRRPLVDAIAARAQKPGADFYGLAFEHSWGPERRRGGDMGELIDRDGAGQIVDRATLLAVGEVSDPFVVDGSWHIIQVTARTPARLTPLSEAEGSIREALARGKRAEAGVQLMARLRAAGTVEILIDLADGSPSAPRPWVYTR